MIRKYALATATAFIFGIASGPVMSQGADKETLHIGAAVSLSGATGVWGQQFEKGMRLLLEQLPGQRLAGHPIKLTVYDTETNSSRTAQLFRRLAENDGVHVIVTGSNSGEGLAIVPLANELKVPALNMGAAEAITTPVTPYVFGISPKDRIVVEHILSVAQKRKMNRVALISSQDGFGQSGNGLVKELASQYGVTLVASETFNPQDTDMTPQILRLKDAKPDAILIWAGNPGPTIIAKNARAIGLQIPVIVSYASAQFLFITQTGSASEGILTSAMKVIEPYTLNDKDPQKALLVKFVNDFKAKYGAAPDQTAGHATDVMAMLKAALDSTSGPLTRDRIRNGLEKVDVCAAAGCRKTSPTEHRGLTKDAMALMQVKGGKWVAVEP
jgi:branched-chain amino acid transport system substrate-binding protein